MSRQGPGDFVLAHLHDLRSFTATAAPFGSHQPQMELRFALSEEMHRAAGLAAFPGVGRGAQNMGRHIPRDPVERTARFTEYSLDDEATLYRPTSPDGRFYLPFVVGLPDEKAWVMGGHFTFYPDTGGAEISYSVNVVHEGRFLATRLIWLAGDVAVDLFGATALNAAVDVDNLGSLRACLNAGLRPAAKTEWRESPSGGSMKEYLDLGIFAHEWVARRAADGRPATTVEMGATGSPILRERVLTVARRHESVATPSAYEIAGVRADLIDAARAHSRRISKLSVNEKLSLAAAFAVLNPRLGQKFMIGLVTDIGFISPRDVPRPRNHKVDPAFATPALTALASIVRMTSLLPDEGAKPVIDRCRAVFGLDAPSETMSMVTYRSTTLNDLASRVGHLIGFSTQGSHLDERIERLLGLFAPNVDRKDHGWARQVERCIEAIDYMPVLPALTAISDALSVVLQLQEDGLPAPKGKFIRLRTLIAVARHSSGPASLSSLQLSECNAVLNDLVNQEAHRRSGTFHRDVLALLNVLPNEVWSLRGSFPPSLQLDILWALVIQENFSRAREHARKNYRRLAAELVDPDDMLSSVFLDPPEAWLGDDYIWVSEPLEAAKCFSETIATVLSSDMKSEENLESSRTKLVMAAGDLVTALRAHSHPGAIAMLRDSLPTLAQLATENPIFVSTFGTATSVFTFGAVGANRGFVRQALRELLTSAPVITDPRLAVPVANALWVVSASREDRALLFDVARSFGDAPLGSPDSTSQFCAAVSMWELLRVGAGDSHLELSAADIVARRNLLAQQSDEGRYANAPTFGIEQFANANLSVRVGFFNEISDDVVEFFKYRREVQPDAYDRRLDLAF